MSAGDTLDRIDAALEDWELGADAMAWDAEQGPHSRADDLYQADGRLPDDVWLRTISLLAIEGQLFATRFQEAARAAFTLIDEVSLDPEAWERLLWATGRSELTPEALTAVAEAVTEAEGYAGLATWPSGDLPKCITSREAL